MPIFILTKSSRGIRQIASQVDDLHVTVHRSDRGYSLGGELQADVR